MQKTTIWKLINQLAQIIKKPEAESALSNQVLSNFQTESPCYHKFLRLKWKMEWLINNVYWNDGITEAVVRRCSATLLRKRLCEFFKFSKNTYFYRAPPVAASGISKTYCHLDGTTHFFISNIRLGKNKQNLTPSGWTFAFWKFFVSFIHVIIQK